LLPESLAITLYLAKKYALGTLYPAALEDQARLWQWSFWAVAEVDRGVNIWSLHAIRLPPDERDVALRSEALKVLAAPFKVLDTAVSQNPYLLGPDFTVADLNVAAVISRAVDMDLSPWPHLKDWLMRCLERPAARKALALKAKSDRETPVEITRRIARTNRL
jgi:glutathione S-transferase